MAPRSRIKKYGSLMTVQVRFCSQMSYQKNTGFQNVLHIRIVDKGMQASAGQSKGIGGTQRKQQQTTKQGDRRGFQKKALFRLTLKGKIGASVNEAGEHCW